MKPYLLAALTLLIACGSITRPVCGCSPEGGGTAVITGLVLDPASTPVPGAAVKLRLRQNGSCEEVASVQTGQVVSGVTGRFRHTTSWTGGDKCFLLWAEPPVGSELAASDSQHVRIDFSGIGARPDSVEVVFHLR